MADSNNGIQNQIWLIGASVRALAKSARRCHFDVLGSDLFADLDTMESCHCLRMEHHPDSALSHRHGRPGIPIAVTGGIENYPDLLQNLESTNPLWCTPPAVLRNLKSPTYLRETLTSAGIATPELQHQIPTDSDPGHWISKPTRSAGGLGIRQARPGESTGSDRYLQRRIEGLPCSVAFLIHQRGCEFLGMTRQLIGTHPLGGPFSYGGSSGPIRPSPECLEQLANLGHYLWREGARGLVGCDIIMTSSASDASAHPHLRSAATPEKFQLIEVNPRYTQSMELIELATNRSLFELHASVFTSSPLLPDGGPGDSPDPEQPRAFEFGMNIAQQFSASTSSPGVSLESLQATDASTSGCGPTSHLGKLIVYASESVSISRDIRTTADRDAPPQSGVESCWLADIPVPGQTIPPGDPICSLLWNCRSHSRQLPLIQDRLTQLSTTLGTTVTLPSAVSETFS